MSTQRTATEKDYAERILRVLVHIQNNLDRSEMDLGVLAALAHFSPFHFHRIFRAMVGEPVKGHVRRLRLERAALRLKHGENTVTDVAFDAGYESHEAFTRAFRTRFGVPPSAYRQTHNSAAPSGVHYSRDHTVETFRPLTLENQTMDARTETLEEKTVAFVRHVGPYNEVSASWQRIYGWAGPKGLLGPNLCAFGMCYDDPEVTPAEHLRYDACIAVPPGTEPDGDIGVQVVPAGEFAATTHVGSYSKLGQVYGQLVGQWMPAHNLEPDPGLPSIEFYRTDPASTPDEENRTDVYMPIKR